MQSEPTTQVSAFIVTLNDGGPEPEPRIGPGMILERGRDRIVVYKGPDETHDYMIGLFRRAPLCGWPFNPEEDLPACGSFIRYLLLSGFRVIREADALDEHTGGKGA